MVEVVDLVSGAGFAGVLGFISGVVGLTSTFLSGAISPLAASSFLILKILLKPTVGLFCAVADSDFTPPLCTARSFDVTVVNRRVRMEVIIRMDLI
jgi:hypothetical protein